MCCKSSSLELPAQSDGIGFRALTLTGTYVGTSLLSAGLAALVILCASSPAQAPAWSLWVAGIAGTLATAPLLVRGIKRLDTGPQDMVNGLRQLNAELEQRLKSTTEELEVSRSRFRFLADAMPHIVWTARADGSPDYYNRRWHDYTGVSLENVSGWTTVIHPEDLDRCTQKWTQALKTGAAYEVDYRFKRISDGSYRWHLGRAVPMLDDEGRVLEWIGTCMDIEDQKRAEKELVQKNRRLENWVRQRTAALSAVNEELRAEIEEKKRFERVLSETSSMQRAILDSANVSIIATDPKGIIRSFNATAQEWLRYRPENIVGKMTLEIFHDPREIKRRAEKLSEEMECPIETGFETLVAKARTGSSEELEWTYVRVDGSCFEVSLSVTAMHDDSGRLTGFLGIARDITASKLAEKAARQSEERFRGACEASLDGFYLLRSVRDHTNGEILDFQFVEVNRRGADLISRAPEDVIGRHLCSIMPIHRESGRFAQYVRVVETGESVEEEFSIAAPHVKASWLRQQVVQLGDGIAITSRDITERKKQEENGRRLVGILEATTDLVGMADSRGTQFYMNRAGRKMLDWADDQRLEEVMMPAVHPEWAADIVRYEGIPVALAEGSWQGETALLRRDGTEIPVSQVILAHKSETGSVEFLSTVMRDISERKQTEARVRQSLAEKEVLLKEVHHRVKNNMQIVSSLLQLQSGYIKDPTALAMFSESQDRIKSMALIHEKLYRSDNVAEVDFPEYLRSLVSMLFAALSAPGIRSQLEIEPLSVGLDTAIPLGLITNELVSNCLKHAFAGQPEGIVHVKFLRESETRLALVVADNGKGIAGDVNFETTSSLGLRLVRILASQIGGELSLHNNHGAEFRVSFEAAAKS